MGSGKGWPGFAQRRGSVAFWRVTAGFASIWDAWFSVKPVS
jgi:hypothetical protein